MNLTKELKVYRNENYLIVESDNIYGEALAKDARVNRQYVNIPDGDVQKYSFVNVNNILTTDLYLFRDEEGTVMFQDENGDPYADEAAFQTFYLANTGKYSGGDTPPLNTFISDDEDNSLQLGGDSKLFSKLPNIARSYSISDADYDIPTDYFFNYFAYTGALDSVFRLPTENFSSYSKSYTIVNQSATKNITVESNDGISAVIVIDGIAYTETIIAPKQILTLVNIDGKFYKP